MVPRLFQLISYVIPSGENYAQDTQTYMVIRVFIVYMYIYAQNIFYLENIADFKRLKER